MSAAATGFDAKPFDGAWLALREPFDLAARAGAMAQLDLHAALAGRRHDGQPLRVLELGCGTASNFRALAPCVGALEAGREQQWLLVDHDPLLLAMIGPAMAHWCAAHGFEWHAEGASRARIEARGWRAALHWQQADLLAQLDALPFADCDLITASALLDLVSEEWLDRVLTRAAKAGAALLFSLTVDGRLAWTPGLPGDARVAAQFAAHQQRDKGFGGRALGARATEVARRRLAELGHAQAQAASDWRIDAADTAMMNAMIASLADAAIEQAPPARAEFEAWRTQRLAQATSSTLVVGHADVLAWPG
ncbi:class I SAM-dependent methyltransferase [Variovorax dokdonensis]|uniref:Class I SAM-dependent methyltransferase n=1 Tax=Variovorax dokdonensis TaxID=344883 RepID=A0ABT7N5R5_9BURK|nr:class I SAM-dependent methyltransferase [Variovorax dokdonensis]MDM0043263.1 class I SAM-dependent methyltransferase [Variovorax dokdonensis]